jgi:isoamylase
VRRTQGGNNNAYCHDNEANWFDWSLVETHAEIHRFVSLLLARRQLRDQTTERQRVSLTQMLHQAKTAWHGVKHLQPDWSPQSHTLAFGAEMRREGLELYVIMNAYWEPLSFELPETTESEPWCRWIDTSLKTPEDIVPWQTVRAVADQRSYAGGPRSVVVLARQVARTSDTRS